MKKILIVDDSKTILSLLRYKFEEYNNIEVLYAENYQDASQIIQKYHEEIEVALLDVNLPDAPDGEVILLANENDIPVIVLTGTLNKKIRQTIQKKDIISYILKDKPSSIELAVQTTLMALKNSDRCVMIVDDSRTIRAMLSSILKKINLKVVEVTNGQEALDILKNNNKKISLVITDYDMPLLNGLDLTVKIRELYHKGELGIIAISAASDKDLIDDFLTFGANDFLAKPFTSSEVIARVNSNLELLCLFSQMKDVANKDFMTGAYNRRYFFDSGNSIFLKAKRKEVPLAAVMLDIDKFKNINDTYGHDVGDMAIKEIKNILDGNLRTSDLMARFGGEEFCILLEDITLEDTQKLFEKIRKKFENNTIDVDGTKITYTVSFGIGYGMLSSLEEMVKLSDDALYESKENGRNMVRVKTA